MHMEAIKTDVNNGDFVLMFQINFLNKMAYGYKKLKIKGSCKRWGKYELVEGL